jgi:hypothetical protein
MYDEKCIYCGGTDAMWDRSLEEPCPNNLNGEQDESK